MDKPSVMQQQVPTIKKSNKQSIIFKGYIKFQSVSLNYLLNVFLIYVFGF